MGERDVLSTCDRSNSIAFGGKQSKFGEKQKTRAKTEHWLLRLVFIVRTQRQSQDLPLKPYGSSRLKKVLQIQFGAVGNESVSVEKKQLKLESNGKKEE